MFFVNISINSQKMTEKFCCERKHRYIFSNSVFGRFFIYYYAYISSIRSLDISLLLHIYYSEFVTVTLNPQNVVDLQKRKWKPYRPLVYIILTLIKYNLQFQMTVYVKIAFHKKWRFLWYSFKKKYIKFLQTTTLYKLSKNFQLLQSVFFQRWFAWNNYGHKIANLYPFSDWNWTV